jgi:hypothetical protein
MCAVVSPIDHYKLLFDMWKSENSVKTSKLQVLMATNAFLISAHVISHYSTIWIPLAGFIFSLVWIFSIGRSVAYQDHWKIQMNQLQQQNPTDPIFMVHMTKSKEPLWGRVPSKYYLVGTPIGTTLAWISVVIYTLVNLA